MHCSGITPSVFTLKREAVIITCPIIGDIHFCRRETKTSNRDLLYLALVCAYLPNKLLVQG